MLLRGIATIFRVLFTVILVKIFYTIFFVWDWAKRAALPFALIAFFYWIWHIGHDYVYLPATHQTGPANGGKIERKLDTEFATVHEHVFGYREDDAQGCVRIQFPGTDNNPEVVVLVNGSWTYLPKTSDYDIYAFDSVSGGEIRVPVPAGCEAMRIICHRIPAEHPFLMTPELRQNLVTIPVTMKNGRFETVGQPHSYQEGECPEHPAKHLWKAQDSE